MTSTPEDRRARVRASGALLGALACALISPALAAPDVEDARSAAPVSCVAEQFALRAYVMALQSGDVTSGAHDPARLAAAITPLCRQAIDSGRWPGLANELLAHAANDANLKGVICTIAPPEAWSAIVEWEGAYEAAGAWYDLPCAVALWRHRPADFARVVGPRLSGRGGCDLPSLPARLGERLRPDERIKLLPALELASGARAAGRDRLYQILCQHPAARLQAVCQAPAVLEPTWARAARMARAAPWIGLHLGLAVLFALAACLVRLLRGKNWPGPGTSAVATAAAAAAVAWSLAGATAPGAAALRAFPVVIVLVAALLGGLIGWFFVRAARGVALPWCLLQAAVYGAIAAAHVWRHASDRLC